MPDPTTDKRFKILDAAVKRQQARPDALIEILHKAQDLFGYLDRPVLWHVARALMQPPSRVYGIATFYHLFRLKPPGKHTCVVCLGTACFVKGAEKLLAEAEHTTRVKSGQTTQDGNVSLVTTRCLGVCGNAPVVVFDDEIQGSMSPSTVSERLRGWIDGTR